MKAEDDFEIRRLSSDHTLMQTATSEDTICLCVQLKERWGKRSGENGHCQCQWSEKESNLATWVGERRLHCPWRSALSVWGRGGRVGDQSFLEYVSKTGFLQQRNLRRLITQIIGNGVGMTCHCCYYNSYRHYPVKSKAAGLGMAGRAWVRAGQGQTRDLDRFCLARWSKFKQASYSNIWRLNRPGGQVFGGLTGQVVKYLEAKQARWSTIWMLNRPGGQLFGC